MIRRIVEVGDPVLRQRARPLSLAEISSDRIRQMISDMRDTMRDTAGVGLAAPQIGETIQLIVVEDPKEYIQNFSSRQIALFDRAPVPFHVLVNPKLTIVADSRADFFEGCLSFKGFKGLVPRALEVRVEALNENGEPLTINARGWYARILQHEVDHLSGVLYVDRMACRTLTTVENLEAHWENMDIDEVRRVLDVGRKPE